MYQTNLPDYLSEEALWNALQKGDEQAYKQIFVQYSDALLSYGLKFTPNRSLVKDCVQMVYVHLFASRARLGVVGNIKGYLLVMMKHELMAQLSNRQYAMARLEEIPSFYIDASACTLPHDGMDDETYRRHCKLMKALDQLPPRQKEAIYLYYIQEIPLKEIAVLMNMEYQSLRNLLSRSLRTLRSMLTSVPAIPLLLLLKSSARYFSTFPC